MARAAASAALLNKELDSLSHDSVRTQRSFSDIDRSTGSFGKNVEKSGAQIDRLSGRLRVLTDVATILAPALVPIGAVGVPAITGLSAQLGFATLAAGTTVLAFQGIGNTLKVLNKAALKPTQENLDAAKVAMEKLSPAARKFAQEIRDLIPEGQRLRDLAASGLFPGVVEGLDAIQGALPRVQAIVSAVSTELGTIAADTGKSLASDRWAPFLDFIATEAPAALHDMAVAAGNTGHAVAELWMATEPLNQDFSKWLVDATANLDKWAAGLANTQGFQDFVAYIQDTGPQVADTFAAIGGAVLKVVEAAAPLGGPVLAGIEALANAVSAIADSDLGTPLFTAAAALALFNRTMAIATASRNGISGFQSRLSGASSSAKSFGSTLVQTRTDLATLGSTALTAGARTERELLRMNSAAGRLKANLAPIGKGAALVGGLAVAASGAADGIGLTNTVSLALAGTMVGPWGTAIGAATGFLIDATKASDGYSRSLDNANRAMQTTDVEKLRQALAGLKKQEDEIANGSPQGPAQGGTAVLRANAQIQDKIAETKKALNFQVEADRANADAKFIGLGFNATSAGLDAATQSADDFKRSLEKVNEVLTGRSTFRDYEQALDDFAARTKKRTELRTKIIEAQAGVSRAQADLASAKTPAERDSAQRSLKTAKDNVAALRKELEGYKNTLDTTTQAGRDTQASIDAIAVSAINYAKSIKDPALRSAFLDNARDQYIKATIEAGASTKAAADLASQIGLLNGVKGKVHITVDASGAVHIISEVDRALQRLRRRLNVAMGDIRRANGGRDDDPNTPFAAGGWTGPGSKWQPAGVVHADEFVFSKEATNGNVAFLESLHRQMRGYADGGLVRRYSAPPVSVSVAGAGPLRLSAGDIASLAQAVAQVRPQYGDVHVNGDPTVWRRQMEQDRRLAGMGGMPS